MNDIKKIIVTTAELADLLDVVPKYISQMINDLGYPKAIGHNAHNLYEFLKYHFSYQEKKCNERVEKIRKEKPQERLIIAQAEYKENEVKKQRKELINAGIVNEAWQNAMQIIVTNIDAFSIIAAPDLIGIADAKEMKLKLDEQVNKLKNKIAQQELHIDTEAIDTE